MPWKYMQYQNGKVRTTSDSGSSTLAGLTDTNISSPSANQFLTYNSSSSKWVNTTKSIPSKLNDLSDVDTSGVANNKVLAYNSSSSKWVPTTINPGGNVDDVQVNGTTVVDENKVAQIKSYMELTRAEYDLLPDTKYSDGVMYCISDGFNNANGFPPLIYSTEEREIGVWIDGKPLYQKSFTSTSSSISTSVTWDISGLNIDKVIKQSGCFCRQVTSNNNIYWYDMDNLLSTNYNYRTVTTVSPSENLIYSTIEMESGNTVLFRAITIQYTKTTDIAGSGKWATDGGLAKHYSTTEQIIGTWIDGKPIYEKTWDLGSTGYITVENNAWTASPIIKAGMEALVGIRAIDPNGAYWGDVMGSLGNDSTYVSFQTGRNGSREQYRWITLQYIKSSS